MAADSVVDGLLATSVCALVLVDVQNDYCHPDGALGRAGIDLSQVAAMCGAIERLRDGAAQAGVPAVVVHTAHSPDTDSPAWRRRGALSSSVCRAGSWGARPFGVAQPRDGDVLITKHRYSGFVGTRLDHVLRAARRTTLVLAGTATNVCVESTARDACMRDYDVVVVGDATTGSDPEAHTASLDNIRRFFGSVVTTDRVLGAWAGQPATPLARSG